MSDSVTSQIQYYHFMPMSLQFFLMIEKIQKKKSIDSEIKKEIPYDNN